MKNKNLIYISAIIFFTAILASAGTWIEEGNKFLNGTFNNTLYNSTGEYIYLNWSDATNATYAENGTYISAIIDLNSTKRFLNISWKGKPKPCPENMAYIDKLGGFCIDQYEASHSDATFCDNLNKWTGDPVDNCSDHYGSSPIPKSAPNMIPWTSISQTAAKTACNNAGKYLCTSKQWLAAANIQGQIYNLPANLADSPYYCVTGSATYCLDHSESSGEACNTGSKPNCVSAEGVYDMVGNVWEWVDNEVTTIQAGATGWYYPSESGDWQTATDSDTLKYGNDGVYFLTGTNTGRAVRRGGSWGSDAIAGPFCADLSVAPSDASIRIGFRCCSS